MGSGTIRLGGLFGIASAAVIIPAYLVGSPERLVGSAETYLEKASAFIAANGALPLLHVLFGLVFLGVLVSMLRAAAGPTGAVYVALGGIVLRDWLHRVANGRAAKVDGVAGGARGSRTTPPVVRRLRRLCHRRVDRAHRPGDARDPAGGAGGKCRCVMLSGSPARRHPVPHGPRAPMPSGSLKRRNVSAASVTSAGPSMIAPLSMSNIAGSGHRWATSARTSQPAQRVGVDHCSPLSPPHRRAQRCHASARTSRTSSLFSRTPPA